MTNCMKLWCEFMGYQGGTIHDALREFQTLSVSQQDKFCGILLANKEKLTDLHHAGDFMHKRLLHLLARNVKPISGEK